MKTRILGVDPSLNCTGWAVIDYNEETKQFKLIDYGFIDCNHFDAETEEPEKLLFIHNTMTRVFNTYKPDVVIAESPFYHKNSKTLIRLSHVHGTMLLLALQFGKKMKYYAPTSIKSAVLGGMKTKTEDGKKKTGDDLKKEVELAIYEIFPRHLFLKDFTNDVTDAIGVALTWVIKGGKDTVGSKPKVKKPRAKKSKKKEEK